MNIDWHNRDFRENYEITHFIYHYAMLHHRNLEVVKKYERPDYIVKDTESGQVYGIELTSVYLDNRSVPEIHMRHEDIPEIIFDPGKIVLYEARLVQAIVSKIQKARSLYDTTFPLKLSIYVNEYISIYMDEIFWRVFVKNNSILFDNLSPYSEIVFWPLPNAQALSVKSSHALLFK